MIRIYKDNDVKVVTNGAYNQLYRPLGYKPIIEEKKVKVVVQEQEGLKPEEPKQEEPKQEEPKRNKESSKPKRRRGE